PVVGSATTLEARIASANDDAEEFSTGFMYLRSSDLELVVDADSQTVGVRWAGLALPSGATITRAWIQFTAKDSDQRPTGLEIQAEDADDAPAFTSTAGDISTRPRTVREAD